MDRGLNRAYLKKRKQMEFYVFMRGHTTHAYTFKNRIKFLILRFD